MTVALETGYGYEEVPLMTDLMSEEEPLETVHRNKEVALMVDLMSGANASVARAFEMMGWRSMAVDWVRDPPQDLSAYDFQSRLPGILEQATFISASLDCSTKSRAREIRHPGVAMPRPLRSQEHQLGLPGLSEIDLDRVTKNNLFRFANPAEAVAPYWR